MPEVPLGVRLRSGVFARQKGVCGDAGGDSCGGDRSHREGGRATPKPEIVKNSLASRRVELENCKRRKRSLPLKS